MMARRLLSFLTYPLVAYAALGVWLEGLMSGKRRVPFNRNVAAGAMFWAVTVLITLRLVFGR
jgi:hypothetical protein